MKRGIEKMRKLLCITLALVLVMALFTGCTSKTEGPAPTSAAPASTAPASVAPASTDPSAAPAESPEKAAYDFTNATKVNLTYAIYLNDKDPTTIDTAKYFDMIKEATGGTVDYTMFPGQSLCNGDEELDAVASGLADVAFVPVAYGSGSLPVSYMLEYPGLAFENDIAASYTVNDWFKQVNPAELSKYKVLYAIAQGNGCFMTNSPVKTFEDFAGKQIRCGAALAPVLESYGIKPTVMVFSEVYEALRTGVVGGFYGMLHAGNSAKLYEVTKAVTYDPYYMGSYLMIMNKDVWDTLTPDQQAAIEDTTAKAFEDFLAAGRAADAAKAVEVFKAAGLEIITLSDADIAKMGAASSPIQSKYAADLDAKGLDGTKALNLFKELGAKYNAQYK